MQFLMRENVVKTNGNGAFAAFRACFDVLPGGGGGNFGRVALVATVKNFSGRVALVATAKNFSGRVALVATAKNFSGRVALVATAKNALCANGFHRWRIWLFSFCRHVNFTNPQEKEETP